MCIIKCELGISAVHQTDDTGTRAKKILYKNHKHNFTYTKPKYHILILKQKSTCT